MNPWSRSGVRATQQALDAYFGQPGYRGWVKPSIGWWTSLPFSLGPTGTPLVDPEDVE